MRSEGFIPNNPRGFQLHGRVHCRTADGSSSGNGSHSAADIEERYPHHPRYWMNQRSLRGNPDGVVRHGPIPHHIICVFSPKGGVGKTFLACNLAMVLAKYFPERVLLLDFNLGCPDVGIHLDLVGKSMVELLPYVSDLTPETFSRFVTREPATGLHALLGPVQPELADLVKDEHVARILDTAKAIYLVSIIDTPSGSDSEILLTSLERADRLILIVCQDAATLCHARAFAGLMEKRGIFPEDVSLVINRSDENSALSVAQVEGFLGIKAIACVPEDRKTVELSIYEGKPIVMYSPASSVASTIKQVAKTLYPNLPLVENQSKTSILSELLKRVGMEKRPVKL